MKDRRVLVVDVVLLAGALVSLLFVFGFGNDVSLSPIEEQDVLFWFTGERMLLLDSEFFVLEEIVLLDGVLLELEPGLYYIDILGDEGEELQEIEVVERVVLRVVAQGSGFGIVNVGEDLQVSAYSSGEYQGDFVFSGGGQ